MLKRTFTGRYYVLVSFIIFFILTSFLIRTALLVFSLSKTDFTASGILRIFFLGLDYDIGVALFLTSLYNLYLLFMPNSWINSTANKLITYSGLVLVLLISFFSFFAELTFWQEFESRFNFIAVDYLIYTYEVVNNINESYPLPLLIGGVIVLVLLVMWLFSKTGIFQKSFSSPAPFKIRALISGLLFFATISYSVMLPNSYAESSTNRYQNELSKAGIYAFFAAFKNNELNYNDFYALLPEGEAYRLIRAELKEPQSEFLKGGRSIRRSIKGKGKLYKPNVIMITVESLSADFMAHFGNREHLMPVLDSLADQNLLFTNMYATGTRTVRGMEALTLSLPPTPGSSIVRRQYNQNLTTVGHLFEKEGYTRSFYYGGDGYFDNMNEYFGSNGFNITDRGRNLKINDSYLTKRTLIPDAKVHFENAWGISDGDLFEAVVEGADKDSRSGRPFYDFVMTTSNHRPFTFPEGKIDLKPGCREAAVCYTDYAIGKFIHEIQQKPWYKNTVVIIVADHCAESAGKNEVQISKYHIPCIVLNLPQKNKARVEKMCSQIDLYPTLFGLLGWSYESNLYGKNVLEPTFEPRAILGTYQKLAYLKNDSLVILGPQQKVETFLYDKLKDTEKPDKLSKMVVQQAMANYQTAYDLFKSGGLHQ
ncbi:sulfatase-like hydrolase/transferase [Pedobacter sp. MC2016-14]|uniref:LTA synthase family protein n=1 Tax=Pedobacter sp. MC2016-14 TaxID=2897327 RepID=UPI001E3E3932|nr:alkaline phosphatase family protein [Pedobacter sp. MC2016-14]MCD0487821.1 sulfatase-like hydrolase/transferase [Pedobacter sp. MC2016-14]